MYLKSRQTNNIITFIWKDGHELEVDLNNLKITSNPLEIPELGNHLIYKSDDNKFILISYFLADPKLKWDVNYVDKFEIKYWN